jgi:hypothetical protein
MNPEQDRMTVGRLREPVAHGTPNPYEEEAAALDADDPDPLPPVQRSSPAPATLEGQ